MINIYLNTQEDRQVSLEVTGHSKRDICIAVSALTNCFFQYAEDFERENMCSAVKHYERGNVKLNLLFTNDEAKSEFLKGTDAIINGYFLYKSNYDKEIKINFVGVVTL